MQPSIENPAQRLLCPECDYDLSGSQQSDRCPWCGWEIDVADLVAANISRHLATRISVAASALMVSAGTMIALLSLVARGRGLDWHDALAVVTVFIVAMAHACLAYIIVRTPRPWPMRGGEVSNTLRVIGWGSIAASLVAATPHLSDAPSPLVARGIQVNGVMEFAMTAAFFSMPGVMLLVLRMVSFRHKGQITWLSRTKTALAGAPFFVEVGSPYRTDQLRQAWSGGPRPTSPMVEERIARTWDAEFAVAREEGRQLYNGRVGRLITLEPSKSALHFVLGETCFRDFLGTNLFHADEVARINPVFLADALGISALIITRDGFLVLGRRSRKVLFHAEHLHTFGGLLEDADRTPQGYDLVGSARRELGEELGVTTGEATSMMVTGLVRDRAILQPELVFDVNVTLTHSDLKDRFEARHDDEHTALEFIVDEPDSLVAFLRQGSKVTPVAQAAILLHGKHRWGVEWYQQAFKNLYGTAPRGK